jgi:hypothetical protein
MADKFLNTVTISSIETVHLIFKTHLDIGFTDFSRNVVQQYFEVFIPTAMETARILRQEGETERFIWTTGSWLIYEYLERADRVGRKQIEDAIEAGDLVWHGLPFTTHTELMDASLFRFGLSLSEELDKRFGRQSIAAKMTDVPGHTRSMIPLLAEAGIQFLHLGSNPASTTPDVPPVFVWKDPVSDTRILVMYQKGAYGALMSVPGLSDAIAFAHTNDNRGPQTVNEVRQAFHKMRQQFPAAKIVASTMDAFARRLLTVEAVLPIVTGEMGDTWIHGVGTDPAKVSRFRDLSRLRRHWLETGQVSLDDPHVAAFSRFLLMIPEHTWGMDTKIYLPDYVNYSAESFREARKTDMFNTIEESWKEQRAYIDDAVKALGNSPLAEEAQQHLRDLRPVQPTRAGFIRISDTSKRFDTAYFEVSFGEQTGAITHLRDKRTGRDWASPDHPIGLFRYQTFSQADYDRYWRQYLVNKRRTNIWSRLDFTKPGIASVESVSQFWQPELTALYERDDRGGHELLLELTPPETSCTQYGCPKQIILQVNFPTDEAAIYFNVQWFEKPACRLPEALWFSFIPKVAASGRWKLDKLGERISPVEVVRDGNRKLHAVDSGIYYQDSHDKLAVETLDAPLVAPGERSLLNFNNRQPNLRKGMHFNLFNNIWGTNFPMWYDDDARFRFVLRLGDENHV